MPEIPEHSQVQNRINYLQNVRSTNTQRVITTIYDNDNCTTNSASLKHKNCLIRINDINNQTL